jgi:hypothetical protein
MEFSGELVDNYDHSDEGLVKMFEGKVPVDIEVDHSEIKFKFSDGSFAHMFHSQECCECVTLEDINGDFNDLLNKPILVAEVRTNRGTLEDYDSCTWTFYTFRGIGGSVDLRWYGTSNGYYSESVDLEWYIPETAMREEWT